MKKLILFISIILLLPFVLASSVYFEFLPVDNNNVKHPEANCTLNISNVVNDNLILDSVLMGNRSSGFHNYSADFSRGIYYGEVFCWWDSEVTRDSIGFEINESEIAYLININESTHDLESIKGNISSTLFSIEASMNDYDIFLYEIENNISDEGVDWDKLYEVDVISNGKAAFPKIRLNVPVESKDDVKLESEDSFTISFKFRNDVDNNYIEFTGNLKTCSQRELDVNYNCPITIYYLYLKNIKGGSEISLRENVKELKSNFDKLKDFYGEYKIFIFIALGVILIVVIFVIIYLIEIGVKLNERK